MKRSRFTEEQIIVILRREGHVRERKRTRRLQGLMVRRRRSRKRAPGPPALLVTEAVANACWPAALITLRGRPG